MQLLDIGFELRVLNEIEGSGTQFNNKFYYLLRCIYIHACIPFLLPTHIFRFPPFAFITAYCISRVRCFVVFLDLIYFRKNTWYFFIFVIFKFRREKFP